MNLRIKTGQLPGDFRKQDKQYMLEKGAGPKARTYRPSHRTSRKAAKSFTKVVRMKERAVLKERTKARLKEEL